jgi:hypothetical protein
MEIGTPRRRVVVEPVKNPVPLKVEPPRQPSPPPRTPEPAKTRV